MDIIFTTLELGKEENLLLDVIKTLEKQVRVNDSFLFYMWMGSYPKLAKG